MLAFGNLQWMWCVVVNKVISCIIVVILELRYCIFLSFTSLYYYVAGQVANEKNKITSVFNTTETQKQLAHAHIFKLKVLVKSQTTHFALRCIYIARLRVWECCLPICSFYPLKFNVACTYLVGTAVGFTNSVLLETLTRDLLMGLAGGTVICCMEPVRGIFPVLSPYSSYLRF